jgi:6-pyruvoyltetrahydropterin/6-carboxytetrahydropterin synthase
MFYLLIEGYIMRFRRYKFKFYLNASHAIYINGALGERHPHTWEITLHVLKEREDFIQFNIVEEKVKEWMNRYQDSFLNKVDPFDTINPTLENCCDYFKDKLEVILRNEGWILLSIEMSETPTRAYIIDLHPYEESLYSPDDCESVADSILQQILEGRDL